MTTTCKKIICPNKFSYGKSDDPDVIGYVCTKCENLYYISDTRTKKTRRNIKLIFITLLLLGTFGYAWFNFDDIIKKSLTKTTIVKSNTPETAIRNFFEHLTDKNYIEAYQLTDNTRWTPLSEFKKDLQYWQIFDVLKISEKSYYSRFEADTILNVVYNAIEDSSQVRVNRDYDFHLKKYGDKWIIIRLLYPRDPKVDALKKSEVPKSPKIAIDNFFSFINKKLYKKAYLLTKNPRWGKQAKFISNNGWGCISNINVYTVRKVDSVKKDKAVFYVKYYASDPCNKSKTYEFYFHLSNEFDYWRIIKATKSYP